MLTMLRAACAVLLLSMASPAFSATIYDCSKSQKRCIVRLDEGRVGDKVRVVDESAYLAASGKIIKRPKSSRYAVIELDKVHKTLQKGYPVLVQVDHKDAAGSWRPHNYKK